MDKLMKCALAFNNLIDKEYYIKAGKKGKLLEVILYFDPINFHHLIGLNKLNDINLLRKSTPELFSKILSGKITHEHISKSVHYDKMSDRLDYFPFLEQILDSEDTIIKHNQSKSGSSINAKAIICNKVDNIYIHYFIDLNEHNGKCFGRTFFPRVDRLYLFDRPYKILEKKKYADGYEINLPTVP